GGAVAGWEKRDVEGALADRDEAVRLDPKIARAGTRAHPPGRMFAVGNGAGPSRTFSANTCPSACPRSSKSSSVARGQFTADRSFVAFSTLSGPEPTPF